MYEVVCGPETNLGFWFVIDVANYLRTI